VAVVGNFNDWDAGRYPMVKGPDGNWTVKVDLRPGQYEYQFVVDGSRFVPDPNATEQRDDGLGGANAVLRL
jgi:1,4-alpha-glucan branching enzyme